MQFDSAFPNDATFHVTLRNPYYSDTYVCDEFSFYTIHATGESFGYTYFKVPYDPPYHPKNLLGNLRNNTYLYPCTAWG